MVLVVAGDHEGSPRFVSQACNFLYKFGHLAVVIHLINIQIFPTLKMAFACR